MITYAVYSHSSYSDCWKPFFGEFRKYCDFKFDDYLLFADDDKDKEDRNFFFSKYKDSDSYTERVLSCLDTVETEFVLFSHEDMMLYDHVDLGAMNECIEAMKDVDLIKLLKGGSSNDFGVDITYKHSNFLKWIPSSFEYIFAVQPTIWRGDKFKALLNANKGKAIWQLEAEGQQFCRDNRYKALYTLHPDDKKRGSAHWDSKVYPYIATAIHKGKWMRGEYKEELGRLFKDYGIDETIRGCND